MCRTRSLSYHNISWKASTSSRLQWFAKVACHYEILWVWETEYGKGRCLVVENWIHVWCRSQPWAKVRCRAQENNERAYGVGFGFGFCQQQWGRQTDCAQNENGPPPSPPTPTDIFFIFLAVWGVPNLCRKCSVTVQPFCWLCKQNPQNLKLLKSLWICVARV